jgi:group I intron endonuclease
MNDNSSGEWKVIGETLIKNDPVPTKDTIKIAGIYGLKNKKTGKWYIGKSIDIHDRIKDYAGLHCKAQPKIYNALIKYGYDGFDVIIIEKCDINTMDEKEIYWIKFYKSFTDGYNLTEGGDGHMHTQETKDKIKKSLTGKKHSLEHRKNQSNAQKLRAKVELETGTRNCDITCKENKKKYIKYIKPILYELRSNKKLSWNKIASELNDRKVLTIRGKPWTKPVVKYTFKHCSTSA